MLESSPQDFSGESDIENQTTSSAEADSFSSLICRVRAGDEQAASILMRDYEPHVRRAIRFRMRNRALRQFLDSIDISQSVMSKFFAKLQAGEFQIASPNELIGLLVRMAQNRVCDWVRRGQSAKMDYRREVPLSDARMVEVSRRRSEETCMPSVESEELMQEVRARLSSLERRLLDRRAENQCWKTIAELEGQSAEAMRTKLRRSLNRVAIELGLLEKVS